MSATAEATTATTTIKAGTFVEFASDHRWHRCQNVNVKLGAGITKIGLVMEDAEVEVGAGVEDDKIKTFTLRQYYVDGRQGKDYDQESLRGHLLGWQRHLHSEDSPAFRSLESRLRSGIAEFEKQYKGE